jgi:glucose-6-phosphate 1-dehydrogenase
LIENSTLVLFGAKGNLSRVKLIPGLFHLDESGQLPDNMKILSVGRQTSTQEDWQKEVKGMLDKKFKDGYCKKTYKRFIERNIYHANLTEDPEAFQKFSKKLNEKKLFSQNLAFFLSVRPSDFALIVDQLADVGLLDQTKGWKRVLIEKPFGTNLKSAIELQESISKHLNEEQIYRIDHYLGKSALQNILITRFANSILEPIWNNTHIDHIQITNHEMLGVGDRTIFYESTGALRDMIQSHLLQMMALTTMEQPKSFSPNDIRDEKIKLLNAIKPFGKNDFNNHTYRAQYAAGEIKGEGGVEGYLNEVGNQDSITETYAAVKIFIDTPRWKGVPIYLRTAKRLNASGTNISIKFKNGDSLIGDNNNWFIFNIQPKESTAIEITTKTPGLDENELRPTNLEGFNRVDGDESIDAYETLMLDLMNGNQSRFLHIDEVTAQWKFVDPIIDYWTKNKVKLNQYKSGDSDPESSKIIFDDPSQFWR